MQDGQSIQRVVEAHIKRAVSSDHSTALMKWMASAVKSLSPKIGENVYVVGGAVRNFVINQPVKDVDMVIDTAAAGRDSAWLAERLAKMIPANTEVITDSYGVGKIYVKSPWVVDGVDLSDFSADGDAAIEIANARAETYADDTGGGYKPNVEWSGIKEDVIRRDFTFNTLMWRLSELADGPDKAEIIDMTGCGLDDLQAGEARCPLDPDKTFHDDPTRMLRAIKFLVKYNLKIPNDTAASIKRKRMSLLKVSPDRVMPELEKILDEDNWQQTLKELDRLGLVDPIKEMLQTHKGFATRFKTIARSRPVRFFLTLVDLGLPVRHELSKLDSEAKKRVWDLSFQMSREQQDAWVAAISKPSNVIKDRNFFPSLAEKQGLKTKGEKGMFMGKATEIARNVILEDPEIIEDRMGLMKEVERRVSGRKASQDLLPIMSPKFNLREVVKQCVLLEDHLFHPKKRCADCIAKHFLTIEALLEEAVSLDKKKEVDADLSGLADRLRVLQMAWVSGADHGWIAQAVRGLRKGLNPVGLLDIRKVSEEVVLTRFAGCIHLATKSHAEKEDEATGKLVKQSPKKKPPRKDLRKEKVDVEKDPDIEDLGAEGDRDLSMNYKRIAQRWLMAEEAPEEAEEAPEEAEGEGEEGEEPQEPAERSEILSQEDIPEELQNLLKIEDFQDESGQVHANLFITGPVDGEYTVSIEHENGSKDEVKANPSTEEGLDALISFPDLIQQHMEVNRQEEQQDNRKMREKIMKRIKKQLPELAEALDEDTLLEAEDFDHVAFKDSYDTTKEFLKNNPMSIPEARVSLNGEAVLELFENSDMGAAEQLGELLARADNARKVHFNPGADLSKAGEIKEISADDFYSQSFAALEYSSQYESDDRKVLVEALNAEKNTLDPNEVRHQEISARVQGHELAAILKEDDFPSENPPSESLSLFISKLSEQEDGKDVFCSPVEDWGTQEFRESLKAVASDLSDAFFHTLFDEGSLAGMVATKIKQARDPDERGVLRDMALEICMDTLMAYEVLMKEVEIDKGYLKECEAIINEGFDLIRKNEDSPVEIVSSIRQGISEVVLSHSGADKKEDLSETAMMIFDKIENHANDGNASVLSQKTQPATLRLFGE